LSTLFSGIGCENNPKIFIFSAVAHDGFRENKRRRDMSKAFMSTERKRERERDSTATSISVRAQDTHRGMIPAKPSQPVREKNKINFGSAEYISEQRSSNPSRNRRWPGSLCPSTCKTNKAKMPALLFPLPF
jgi:hypothetical protein